MLILNQLKLRLYDVELYLNTSYVDIKLRRSTRLTNHISYLNTSYVDIKLEILKSQNIELNEFKYILC